MDYQRIYNELIEKARSESRVKVKGGPYYEAHHIIPKCLGGGGKVSEWRTHPNIILLTAGEHFYAHYYLTKIHSDNYKLSYAFWAMCNLANRNQDRDYLEVPDFVKLYEEAKKGKKQSKEARVKISIALKGRKLPPRSEETKAKMSAAKKGKPGPGSTKGKVLSKEHRAKISSANRGKPKSEEAKTKMREAWKKRGSVSEETRAKLREAWKLRREGKFLNKS